ncbi:MAG: pilus assembly protein [Candidatus Liberibacter ctenarytainae]|uniref:Pilus assembly protein n=1 Tax=Candidatus Liberibacter ctenarytainae TaxID=2020335 RepID=A0A937AK03_9HYPH|nr:pilus assembly protein [Candidatus Liberibacter ctenarytainae]
MSRSMVYLIWVYIMKKSFLRSFKRAILIREGAVAIEFSMLVIPYFLVVFAILEISISLVAEQLFDSTAYTLARKISTGEVRANTTHEQFKKMFCDEIKILFSCEETTKKRFFMDVQKIQSLHDISTIMPKKVNDKKDPNEADYSRFGFRPGGSGTYNVLRAYYYWPLMTDFMSYMLRGTKGGYILMRSVIAFKNEPFLD